MIVVFGANGRTGREVIREARLRNIDVRPVARDDHDTRSLEDLVSVNEIAFANADHKESLPPVLEGATAIISCIDARTAGWGCPQYDKMAASNVVQAAHNHGITKILHLSVMGAYRWSPNALNRQSFHLDRWIKRSKVPWTMLKISCYHDELIDAHVRPPDGGTPHPIKSSARYAPVSRRDVARTIIRIMPNLIPSRTWLVGGPKVYGGKELTALINPYIQGQGRRTHYGRLPHGDMSVHPETTETMLGWIPQENLEWALDPKKHPIEDNSPFWNRPTPGAHPADRQKPDSVLQALNKDLRYVLHALLVEDLPNINITQTDVWLDFSTATVNENGHTALPHKALMQEMFNIRILNKQEIEIYCGNITFFYDELADAFFVWWDREKDIPMEVWNQIDLGVRRRLAKHPRWKKDPKVRNFAASLHEKMPQK